MIRVGVVRGGANKEAKDSVANGSFVIRNLPRDLYEPIDLFIDSDGVWHHGGLPLSYEKLKQRVDVIWNALYGYYGADGQVEQLFENLGIPYVGASPFASALSMNKKMTREHLSKLDIDTPEGIYIENWGDDDRDITVSIVANHIVEKLSPPWIVEPISLTQSAGPIRAKNRNELIGILNNAFELQIPVLVEKEVFGKNVSVIALSNFRNKPVYTFLPVHHSDDSFKNYISENVRIEQEIAQLHKKLNLGNYTHFKCVVDNKGRMSVTGIETKPALHPGAPLHHALKELGVTFEEFAKSLIDDAMQNKK